MARDKNIKRRDRRTFDRDKYYEKRKDRQRDQERKRRRQQKQQGTE